jgi:hypothetical protein
MEQIEKEKKLKERKDALDKMETEKAKELKEKQEELAEKEKQNKKEYYSEPLPVNLSEDHEIYKIAGIKYGVSWQIISAVHFAETKGSRRHTRYVENKSSHAGGCTQFIPSTFKRYGVDGDGDGKANRKSCQDMIFSTANYLRALKNSGKNKKWFTYKGAVWGYNHAMWYVNGVKAEAKRLGFSGE